MTSKDVIIKIENLRYALDDVDMLMRASRKEQYEKGSYISLLKLYIVSERISDLIEAFDNLTKDELSIIGG